MLNANTVVEVGFQEYRRQFLVALNYCVRTLDDALDQRSDAIDSEGFALIADTLAETVDLLTDMPDQLLQVFRAKLAHTLDADPSTVLLNRHAIRDLIAELVDQGDDDAFLTAVNRGRSTLTSLPAQELASAGEAVEILEGLLRSTEVFKPIAMRPGLKMAKEWFEMQQANPLSLSDISVGNRISVTPPNMMTQTTNVAGSPLLKQKKATTDASSMKLVAEYPASLCPPIGKALAFGMVEIIEDHSGLRVAVFKAKGHTPSGLPMGQILNISGSAKPKMGGRIDLSDNYYLIIGGGKSSAKAFLSNLTQSK